MQSETFPLDETNCCSKAFIDYISGDKKLKPFYRAFPSTDNFKSVIDSRNFSQEKRAVLTKALSNQYNVTDLHEAVSKNLTSLSDEKTFTITTGHQLNIFTGPLYFLYKIITVINTCKELKKDYPEYHFVPVYWMASEDHDFEEISYFHFEGKKITWQTDQKGAVGKFDPSALKEIADKLPKGAAFFKDAYDQATLADAVRSYVNYLFEDEGLIVIDADDPDLKQSLIPVIEDDLFHNIPEKLVNDTSAKLEALDFKCQVNPREINFFYLKGNVRERIEKSENGFEVVDTEIRFSESEMKDLIKTHPEQFSPNVILRPLYQEMILPNLAYVGGPSELIYWLQLKSVFEHFDVSFPLLMPRNFALVCSKTDQAKWEKTGLPKSNLFLESEDSFAKWVSSNSSNHISYSDELEKLEQLEKEMKAKAEKVDPTLLQHVEAIHTTFKNKLDNAEKKLLRAEKKKHEDKKAQIAAVKESLFPGGTLQERKVNFLNFYLKDPQFIQNLKDVFDPFNFEMYLLLD